MLMNLIDADSTLFLNCTQAAEYIGIGRRSFYYLKDLDTFPVPKRLFGKTDYYLREDIYNWAKSLPYVDKIQSNEE